MACSSVRSLHLPLGKQRLWFKVVSTSDAIKHCFHVFPKKIAPGHSYQLLNVRHNHAFFFCKYMLNQSLNGFIFIGLVQSNKQSGLTPFFLSINVESKEQEQEGTLCNTVLTDVLYYLNLPGMGIQLPTQVPWCL